MSIRLRKVLKVTGIVVVIIITIGIVSCNIILPPPISKTKMERIFTKDRELLGLIVENFQNSGYFSINVYNNDKSGFMRASDSGDQMRELVPIDDPEMIRTLDILFNKKGYQVINKKGNTIYFQRWSAIMDRARGIAYTIDGSAPEIEFLTYYAELSEEHWYYCEIDFNEYKRRLSDNK